MPAALIVTTVDITLEAFLMPFARHLRDRGWTVDALSNGATTNPRIAEAYDRRFDISWSRNPLAPGNLIGAAGTVRKIVAEGGYDVVWVHTPIAAWVTRYALRKTGVPVVYTAHGFHFYQGQKPAPHAAFRAMERVAAPWTAELVTINAEDYSAAAGLGFASERKHLIPGIGVDTDALAPGASDGSSVRRELALAEDDCVLTMIAEFTANKRHRMALEALARVADPSVRLVFVGSGPEEGTVREAAAALKVMDRVVFAGYRRDIANVLAASDVLLLCSEREGLNRSGLEAMASGVPVMGTATRGIADLIGDDEAGWVTPKYDAEALAGAIEAAAADRDERERRGTAARERAVREFSLVRVLAAYDELFDSVLAGRSAGAS